VRTGNTRYGVQNLAYDETQRRWFMGVYRARSRPSPTTAVRRRGPRAAVTGDLVGVPGPGGKGWEQGLLLALADDGLKDPATGVRGWNQKADVGSSPSATGCSIWP
jgi:hypothetical protein